MLKLHLETKQQILAFLLNFGPKTLITRKRRIVQLFQEKSLTFEENKDKNQWFVRNCILLPKWFWPTVRKKGSSDREKLLQIFGLQPRICNLFHRHWSNLLGQNHFWNITLSKLFTGGFHIHINGNHCNLTYGIRCIVETKNLQEQVRKFRFPICQNFPL